MEKLLGLLDDIVVALFINNLSMVLMFVFLPIPIPLSFLLIHRREISFNISSINMIGKLMITTANHSSPFKGTMEKRVVKKGT